MAVDKQRVFDVLRCAQRLGALDKLLAILGQAVEEALDEGNLTTLEVLAQMDDVQEIDLMTVDMVLEELGGMVMYLDDDKLMTYISHFLDDDFLKTRMVQRLKSSILEYGAMMKETAGLPPSPIPQGAEG
jgi:hypothetical protein